MLLGAPGIATRSKDARDGKHVLEFKIAEMHLKGDLGDAGAR